MITIRSTVFVTQLLFTHLEPRCIYDEEHSRWEERTHLSWNEASVKTSALWIYVKLASGVNSEEPSNLEENQEIVVEAEERRERLLQGELS